MNSAVVRIAIAIIVVTAVTGVLFAIGTPPSTAAAPPARASTPAIAPAFTATQPDEWINSQPLQLKELRGKPVLVEFWTFGCSNCRNTLPWLKAAHEQFASRGLTIVGVHTPEFAHERDPKQVQAWVKKLDIRYPVMLDPDFAYWNSLSNRYWPAFYLLDAEGRIVATRVGELHAGQERTDSFTREIEQLLPGNR
jgi:thiol-disulfide isomerase/thioredoxin